VEGNRRENRRCNKENTRKKQKPCHQAKGIVIGSNRIGKVCDSARMEPKAKAQNAPSFFSLSHLLFFLKYYSF
jgi:hypothetical protein